MRKIDRVMREILHQYHERGRRFFNQRELAETCGLSLGTVNPLVSKFELMGMVERRPLGFRLVDPRRMLLYWAATREISGDVVYTTFSADPLPRVEERLSSLGLLTAHAGYRRLFGSVPVDYSSVFVYAPPEEVRRVYGPRRKKPNLFVLTPDEHLMRLGREGAVPPVQLYVDLWQLGSLAGRLLEELERRLGEAPVRAVEEVARRREELSPSGA
jgi:DNA-binding Lrp family transcriptional regulator